MKWFRVVRIHPLLLIIFFTIFASGEVALYAMIFISLLVHEAGHLFAAYYCHVNVKSCILLPYGAEITFAKEEQISPQQLLIIAIAGPLATSVFIVIAYWLPPMYQESLLHIQYYLLVFNMLPLWSLDGGRIVYALILLFCPYKKVYERYVMVSLFVTSIGVIMTVLLLPNSMPVVILSSFLWMQVWKEWRYRKYRAAFEKYVMYRLT